jgi:hypothetical protein
MRARADVKSALEHLKGLAPGPADDTLDKAIAAVHRAIVRYGDATPRPALAGLKYIPCNADGVPCEWIVPEGAFENERIVGRAAAHANPCFTRRSISRTTLWYSPRKFETSPGEFVAIPNSDAHLQSQLGQRRSSSWSPWPSARLRYDVEVPHELLGQCIVGVAHRIYVRVSRISRVMDPFAFNLNRLAARREKLNRGARPRCHRVGETAPYARYAGRTGGRSELKLEAAAFLKSEEGNRVPALKHKDGAAVA